jgi:hypothetical protein
LEDLTGFKNLLGLKLRKQFKNKYYKQLRNRGKEKMKRLVLSLTIVSMMCIVPSYGLRAQGTKSAISIAHELTPWKNTDTEKWGLKNKNTGKIIVPAQYDEIDQDAKNGFFLVGIIGRGKEITSFIYVQAFPFVEERALVVKDSGVGFIDKTGKEVIPCIYDKAKDFKDGKTQVEFDSELITIDLNGKK